MLGQVRADFPGAIARSVIVLGVDRAPLAIFDLGSKSGVGRGLTLSFGVSTFTRQAIRDTSRKERLD